MKISHHIYPLETLGYGKRLGIWVAGCNHSCKNCISPDLWDSSNIRNTDVVVFIQSLFDELSNADGVTISGGEPFDQPKELSKLVYSIKEIFDIEILIYSGYTLEELKKKNNSDINKILNTIDILIDGKYVDDLNDNLALRGSSNQNIIFFNEGSKDKYKPILKEERKLQNHILDGVIYMFGIPKKGFKEQLDEAILEVKQNIRKDD